MPSVVLHMGGIKITLPDAETLRKVVFSKEYWRGFVSNTAMVSLRDDINVCIVICYHQQQGFYLHYFDSAHEEWVSVGDKNKLAEIVEHCGDGDGPVSCGLFVSAQKAWAALEEFGRTGRRSEQVEWLLVNDLPEGAAW